MQNQTTIQCSACNQPIQATIYSVIDVTKTPQAKALLLSGRLNTEICPNCGTENHVATPLLYHDPTKELLVAYVPMEINMTKDEQEKAIGSLMNQLPKENFKAYMFSPKRALTMQGLTDLILEADGVTPEMMEEQRARVQLAQQFVEAPDEQTLAGLVKQHDDKIDMQLLQTLTLMAQRALEGGQQQVAQAIINIQNYIAERSSFGQELIRQQTEQQQVVEEVASTVREMGAGAGREDFLKLAIEYADDDNRLQALVGLARAAFDYEFFQLMTTKIGEAPAAERDKLNALRERLVELTSNVDQQEQAAVQNAAGFLQALLNEQNPEELLRANIPMVDDVFMAVLNANIEHAEKQANVQAATRLKQIRDLTISIVQENMQPELRFVNQLLSVETDEEAQQMLQEHAAEYGEDLLEIMDAVEGVLSSQQGNEAILKRLETLRAAAQATLNT